MIKEFFKKQIHSIYLNTLLRGIAFSLFGIFVPIYFLKLGYPLSKVFSYFLVFQLTTFISIFAGYKIAKKVGYKPLIIASAPLLVIFIFLIQMMEFSSIPIYLIATVMGIQSGFYWLPIHNFFNKLSEKNIKGTQFSNYVVFGQISGLIGPLIGAIVATTLGFKYLFTIVLVFILISIYPLLKLQNIIPKEKIKLKKLKTLAKNNKGFVVGTFFDNIKGEIEGIIWPIFVYLFLENLISVGSLGALITLGSMFLTLFIGRYYDRKSKYLFLRIGGVMYAIMWLLRAYYDSSIIIFVSSFFAGFFGLMIEIPFSAIFYDKTSEEKKSNTFIIFREIPIFFARMVLWISAIFIFKEIKVLFVVAAISNLLFSFLDFGIKKNNKENLQPPIKQ